MSQAAFLRRLVHALDEAGIPYMLVDSLVSSAHSAPLATQDIDIVVDLDERSLERLVGSLPADRYYLDFDTAREALAARPPFNVIELASGWNVDLIVRKDRAFSVEELERRVSARIQDTEVRIASPEDTVLSKLEWAALGESERQLRDAAGVIAVQAELLDRPYVERWSALWVSKTSGSACWRRSTASEFAPVIKREVSDGEPVDRKSLTLAASSAHTGEHERSRRYRHPPTERSIKAFRTVPILYPRAVARDGRTA